MNELPPKDDSAGRDEELSALLGYLREHRGVDLTGYKLPSLRRRILRRMRAVEMTEFPKYLAHLAAHPDEIGPLLDTALINVTSFFRDPEAWHFVASEVVPRLLRDKAPDGTIRVWSAGCASGQEPFTAAMMLAEAMGFESFCRRVKIYATDLDEPALQQARRARYPIAELDAVPVALRGRYFEQHEGVAALHNGLRRSVIFGRHDLLEDAPISRIDLLLCRNTLMYFNAAAQSRILGRLHFALLERGFIMLGRAEMLLSHADSFAPVDLKHRVFAKIPAETRWDDHRFLAATRGSREEDGRHVRLREAALDASPAAQLVLDGRGRLALVNERARLLFHLGPPDIGRPLQDLELSYRPVDLRSMIDDAHEQRRPARREGVERKITEQDSQYLDVVVTPVARDGAVVATIITFTDVTHHHQLQDNLQRFSENLETAYEELQSANEELETTNEELQSANEELETTNEELQAANEEMETVNEELRSTNDELSRANERLRDREEALHDTNALVRAILASLRAGVIVVGADLSVRIWNDRAAELWGLRADEVVGKPLTKLDIGLPVGELEGPLRACLGAEGQRRELMVEAVNRRGRGFRCRVVVDPLPAGAKAMAACVLMEEVEGDDRSREGQT